MSQAGRLIRAVRRSVPVRDRTKPTGMVRYTCSKCMMSVRVTIACGVELPGRRREGVFAVAPKVLDCAFCEGDLELDESTWQPADKLVTPYLRVPSKRAPKIVRAGALHAQLVTDDDRYELD